MQQNIAAIGGVYAFIALWLLLNPRYRDEGWDLLWELCIALLVLVCWFIVAFWIATAGSEMRHAHGDASWLIKLFTGLIHPLFMIALGLSVWIGIPVYLLGLLFGLPSIMYVIARLLVRLPVLTYHYLHYLTVPHPGETAYRAGMANDLPIPAQALRKARLQKDIDEIKKPPEPPPEPPKKPSPRARSEKQKRRAEAYKRYEKEIERIEKMKVSAKTKAELKKAAQNELEKELRKSTKCHSLALASEPFHAWMKEGISFNQEAYMPHDWVNYKSLRAELSFIEILHHYGVELKERGEQWQGFCPLPTHEGKRRSPSFSANVGKGIWQCFGCGAKGNVIEFAARMEGLNPDESG